ncbi:MAG: ParA family protein [Marinobacterium sp.]|nr:ParA family protein [Marinobacterium sp.]
MRRVVFNQKGGVGKSSIAANLAAISASRGRHTLLIDLDPQGNASHYLLGDAYNDAAPDVRDFFEQTLSFQLQPRPVHDFVHPTTFDHLSVVPSSPLLGELQSRLESRHKIYKLRDAVQQLSDIFDCIIIDTPPAFNFFTLSALVAAERCLIPFDCDEFARQALYSLLGNVQETCMDHNDQLRVEGIVVNQYQPRASLPRRIVADLEADDLPVLDTRLSSSVKMKESHDQCCPLVYMAPAHKLTCQFMALYDELEQRAL